MKKPIIEIQVNSWNKQTRKEQGKAAKWLFALIEDLLFKHCESGVSDTFTGRDR